MTVSSNLVDALAEGVSFLRILHRGPDGYAPLHWKLGERLNDIGSVRVPDFAIPSSTVPRLRADAYVGINSMFMAGRLRKADESEIAIVDGIIQVPGLNSETRLPYSIRRNDHVRWLNACYCDIDARDGSDGTWL